MNTEISNFVLPTAPVKTLWFEFLFSEGLLESHLESKHCDPTPIELMIQFLSNAQSISPGNSCPPTPNVLKNGSESSENRDESNRSCNQIESEGEKKSFHLKLLALKVMSYMDWNLEVIESKLSLTMQHILVGELKKRCKGTPCEIFSIITYHRWLIRSLVKSTIPIRNYKVNIPNMPVIDPLFIPFDILNNLTIKMHKEVECSINQLLHISLKGDFSLSSLHSIQSSSLFKPSNTASLDPLQSPSFIKVPTISTFKVKPTGFNEDGSKNYYDWSACREISSTQLLSEIRYELGKFFFIRDMNFVKASQLFELIPVNDREKFEHLNGYITASRDMNSSSSGQGSSGQLDEIEMSDPVTWFRSSLEDVIQGKCVDTRSIERRLTVEDIAKEINRFYKHSSNPDQKNLLSIFSAYLSCRIPALRNLVLPASRFTEEDDSPRSPSSHDHEMDIGTSGENILAYTNEQIFIGSTEPEVILDLSAKVTKSPTDLNSNYFVPRILVSLTNAISSPTLSNKCLLVLAKANELRQGKMFIESRTLYLSVLEEVQALVPAIFDLLSLEILHNDLQLNLASNDVDERRTADLLAKCTNILRNEPTVQELSPELIQLSCLYLLDNSHPCLKDYPNYTVNPFIRFSSLLHLTSKPATSLKFSKDFWDSLIFPLLQNDTNSSVKKMKSLPVQPTFNVSTLTSFITKIKSPALITVIASALIKMHNLVKDSASSEISMIPTPAQLLWPTALPTTSIMPPLETIYLVLIALVNEVSKFHPNDVTWIKVKAELALIRGELKQSLKYFLEMLIIQTSYFTSFTCSVEEEDVIKKLIIVCNKLNCHTSSAILQQMVTVPNYALAFKSLGERSCFDSADHLYDCIWDVNLLEYLVNLHTKRGDMERKLKANQLIGQLELNANNSKEILLEAANVKKKCFFRILAKKYM